MTHQTQDRAYRWFLKNQTPAGWFDVISLMIEGMMANVGEQESHPFLRQVGKSLAESWPLEAAETLGALEKNFNEVLNCFNWGVVTLTAVDDSVVIRHLALPVTHNQQQQLRWCHAFSAILEGLYGHWMLGQGGSERMVMKRSEVYSVSDVEFHYFNVSEKDA
ncbi:cellulose synthase [Enterobacteriaceae bacterium RIT691]|nr:cellulose synthase [Enterobacteriaceae bacterium RIT691]